MYPRAFLAALIAAVALVTLSAAGSTSSTQSPFVGAGVCQECHANYHQAWASTKHSRALNRLGAADREGTQCLRCHTTGTPEMIAADGATPSLPGVQCEACHGSGRAHVDAAKAGGSARTGIIKKPDEAACTRCHNQDSPHYKPFYYAALIGLVHRVKN